MPHTVIADNAGGHLMRQGEVDLCIVGTDRTTAGGDVANKIGTYLKALAAHDNGIPFYVALPSPTIDWEIEDGAAIPIERRDQPRGHPYRRLDRGRAAGEVRLTPDDSPAANFAFDVTPARLVTGADHRARRLPRLARWAPGAFPGTRLLRHDSNCPVEESGDGSPWLPAFAKPTRTRMKEPDFSLRTEAGRFTRQ